MKLIAALALTLTLTTIAAHADLAQQINALGCSSYKPDGREYKLSLLNASAGTDAGLSYPSNTQTLFRGAYASNTQFDLDVSLRALFNQRNFYIGSPMFFGIHQILTGKWTLETPFFPNTHFPFKMYKYLSVRGILDDVNELLKCRPKFYSDEEANLLSADLMNKYYFGAGGAAVLIPRYFNISEANYYSDDLDQLGFANHAADFVTTTTYDQVASIYGIKTLVLRDRRNRGFDLGWWNKVHGGAFWQSWVDNGEIDIPGYVTPDEIIGFQQRTVDRVTTNWGQGAIDNPVDLAYYRMNVNGKTVVAIIDGDGDNCIIQGKDSRFYSCERNWGNITTAPVPFPTPHSESVSSRKGLVGVVELCPNGQCDTTSDLFKTYGRYSNKALPAEVVKELSSLKINGTPVKVLLAKDSPEARNQAVGIKVLVATYASVADAAKSIGNVTKAAAAFADGKESVEYKVSPKYLGVGNDSTPRLFSIDWICGGQDPKNLRHVNIPAPAAGKTFKISCE